MIGYLACLGCNQVAEKVVEGVRRVIFGVWPLILRLLPNPDQVDRCGKCYELLQGWVPDPRLAVNKVAEAVFVAALHHRLKFLRCAPVGRRNVAVRKRRYESCKWPQLQIRR